MIEIEKMTIRQKQPNNGYIQLPQGWEIKKLGEVCKVIAGQSPEGKYYNTEGIGLPFYQGKKEFTDKYIGKPTTWTTKTTKESEENDILMSVRAPVGPINFSTQKICIGRGLAAIRAGKLIDREFLFNFLLKHEDEIVGNTGAVFNSINKAQIEAIEIPYPKINEQVRIVEILGGAFDDIAKAKAIAEQNLKNSNELFENYLQLVFTNKNNDWGNKTLKNIGVTQTGTTPKTDIKDNYGDFISFIKPADIDITGNGEIRYDNDGLSEQGLKKGRRMEKGSILMVCIGATIGKVGFVDRDVSCNQQINSLTVKNEYYPKFFYYALSTKVFFEQVMQNAAQATLPIINKSKWEALIVSYPKSLKEQQTIVQKLDALSLECKKLESIYQQKVIALDELKKSILQKAFSGQLS